MHWLDGHSPPAEIAQPLMNLLRRIGGDKERPSAGLVFLDRGGHWFKELASLDPAGRRGVIAVAEEPGRLEAAVRWGCGGAILLPPSLHRVRLAVAAVGGVDRARPGFLDNPEVSTGTNRPDLQCLRLTPTSRWDRLHTLREQIELLAALGRNLERPCVVVPGPGLVMQEADPEVVRKGWVGLPTKPCWATASHLAVGGHPLADGAGGAEWLPVSLWPDGRETGRWMPEDRREDVSWRLEIPDGRPVKAVPVRTPEDVAGAASDIVRIVGLPGSELAVAGAPGSVLAEAIARTAETAGRIAWIPNVPRSAMPIVRNWGVDVWVDGPAVGCG